MTDEPRFELIELQRLREHEEIDPGAVQALADRLRRDEVVQDPIWVARGSWVVLNGHHRVAALKRLGATRAPAWVFDYDSPAVHLERWSDGPPLSKAEVVERARRGQLYPPKTTRHVLDLELPLHPTPLAELFQSETGAGAGPQRRASARSRPSGAGAPGAP